MAALRRTVAAFRPALARRLREKHGVELLAIYSYPAQVVFCKAPFARLADLAGRRVRTSSVSQADFVQALGATPVTTGFAELVPQFQAGTLDCAITGTMSGNAIGLHELSSHVGALPVNFGLSAFVANVAAWEALPADVRATIQRGLARVEQAIWDESDRETPIGLACNTGGAPCVGGRPGRMTLVPVHPDDDRLRRELFAAQVLPRWVARCGADCAGTWNGVLAPVVGVPAPRP
jgi:hypothetical protein